MSLHNNSYESYLYLNKAKICKSKALGNITPYKICFRGASKNCSLNWTKRNCIKWCCIWFFNSMLLKYEQNMKNIIHNHKHLIKKHNIKWYFCFLNRFWSLYQVDKSCVLIKIEEINVEVFNMTSTKRNPKH